ncbi:putative reverse transcriptase domain-containing protein [Tanacetum coccineum]
MTSRPRTRVFRPGPVWGCDKLVSRAKVIENQEKNANNKRKFENQPKDNHVPRQPPCKKPSVTTAYTIEANGKKAYAGNLPYSNKYIKYPIELVNRKLIGSDIMLRGCTLGLLGHPFNIDLIPVELGSFDVMIGMDWLANHHTVIACDEKIVQIPYGDEVLIIQGDSRDKGKKSKLSIISCTKTQKYINRGCGIFSGADTSSRKKETRKDKSEEKRLEDVPTVQDFLEVFPEDLLDYHQRDNYKNFLTAGFLRPVPRPWGARISVTRKIDLRSSYHQLRVRDEYIPKTAFRTRYSHVRFQVNAFGLTIARPFIHGWMIRSKEEHAKHLKLILELLKKEELYAKFSKCDFWLSKVQFLGHVIDSEGIHVNPAKIESIKDWASPKTPTEIRQFLGLAGYYQRFFEGFPKIAKPMTKLTQKNLKFDWSEKAEAAFQLLKQKLCSIVLMQIEKVIAYASRQLRIHEENYTTHDLELGAVVFALKIGKSCLMEHESTVVVLELSKRTTRRDSLSSGKNEGGGGCLEPKRTD